MRRVRLVRALVVSALLLVSACADSPTAPSQSRLAPIPAEPSFGILTPIIFPPGADWGHYFVSFNQDRHLSVKVIHYPDNSVRGNGIFVIPGVGAGTLKVTTLERTFDGCTPYSTPCDPQHRIPESSEVSGVGRIGLIPLTFTLVLDSHLWPPQGWTPGTDPGTNYDEAILSICVLGDPTDPTRCTIETTTRFFGELHHEPT